MDHWGDPWADNANDKSPTKNAVTSPLPPAFAFNSVPINGFVDDAGWGNNDDDDFNDWTSPSTGDAPSTNVLSTPAGEKEPGSAGWDTVTYEGREDIAAEWPGSVSSAPQGLQKVDSEPSDSSTVSQLDESDSQGLTEEPVPLPQTDIESSVRSSSSPSETSRNEVPVESPRTSIEDERIIGKDGNEPLPIAEEVERTANTSPTLTLEDDANSSDDLNAIASIEKQVTPTNDTDDLSSYSPNSHQAPHASEIPNALDNLAMVENAPSQIHSASAFCDQGLLSQLFPTGEGSGKQLDEHDDPIFSTSARKAWYRLTRKQTMREFNHGDNDDNYIRVTWTNSRVRADVHKIVGRWAREDRISGTGPGARASFYWDTPAPIESAPPFSHSRTQSSVPVTKTALPARQSLPPLATNQSSTFDWSSPASTDPWKIESLAQRSSPTPLALKNPVVAKLQRQEGRSVSVDLTTRTSEQTTHKRSLTASHTTPETTTATAANLTPSPAPHTSAVVSDSWANFDSLDSPSVPHAGAANLPVDDDDDEWGEMVQTPTLPTPQQLDPFPRSPTTDATPSPPLSPRPSSSAEPQVQAEPVDTTFSSPIVRLQSTISPTSALFKTNAFVPLNAEQGPIGPSRLKPANRSGQSPADKKPTIDVPEEMPTRKSGTAEDKNASSDEIIALSNSPQISLSTESDVIGEATAESSVVADPAIPVQPLADSWADADFSFFESSQPATVSHPPSQTHDSSDPFSFFDGPAPTEIQPVANASSQLPSFNRTPSTSQRSTEVINPSQLRRTEEVRIISDILGGLPDLSYMLKR